jgi:hypothetical protein
MAATGTVDWGAAVDVCDGEEEWGGVTLRGMGWHACEDGGVGQRGVGWGACTGIAAAARQSEMSRRYFFGRERVRSEAQPHGASRCGGRPWPSITASETSWGQARHVP